VVSSIRYVQGSNFVLDTVYRDAFSEFIGSTALLLGRGLFFNFDFFFFLHYMVDSLDGGSAHRKAATYTQNSTNTE
jgi:hypothetical protein